MGNKIAGLGCFSSLVFVVFNVLVGGWSVDVILSWLGKDIPMFGDCIIGLFVAEISVPIAIIGKLLSFFGVF